MNDQRVQQFTVANNPMSIRSTLYTSYIHNGKLAMTGLHFYALSCAANNNYLDRDLVLRVPVGDLDAVEVVSGGSTG
jgi:hypothetical protein